MQPFAEICRDLFVPFSFRRFMSRARDLRKPVGKQEYRSASAIHDQLNGDAYLKLIHSASRSDFLELIPIILLLPASLVNIRHGCRIIGGLAAPSRKKRRFDPRQLLFLKLRHEPLSPLSHVYDRMKIYLISGISRDSEARQHVDNIR